MRNMFARFGWLSQAMLSVRLLKITLVIWGGYAIPAGAESFYGLPVVKTVGGYKLVDIRSGLSSLEYVNDRARTAFSIVNATTPVCDVSIYGWKTAVLTPAQISLATVEIPSTSKLFLFTPHTSSSMYVIGAMYYQNGKWHAVHAGASRENECNHMYDIGDGRFSPAGYLFANWCGAWSKELPTVVVMMDYYKTVMTYGVVLGSGASEPPSTDYPPAPDSTYELISGSMTWEDAWADADARGGYLATITSPAEWNNILGQVGSAMLGKDVWLGGNDLESEGTWKWVTGEAWNYSRWASGQPNNAGGAQHRLQLMGSSGSEYQWDDQSNILVPYYLLEKPKTSTPAAPDHTYILIQNNATWEQAWTDANAKGGYLATITSEEEWNNIINQVGSAMLGQNVWLGGHDLETEGSWQWVTGEAWNYSRWASGQPNNRNDEQHRLQIMASSGSSYLWDDQSDIASPFYLLERAEAPSLSIDIHSCDAPAAGLASQSISVSANVPWTATANQSWIHITAGASGMDGGTVAFYAVANEGGGARSGTITISGYGVTRTVTVNQGAALIELDFDSACLPASGSEGFSFTLKANVSWAAASDASWITILDGATGVNDGQITFRSVANPGLARSGTIRIFFGGLERVFTVLQWPQPVVDGVPTEGDYDGDGVADLAVFQPAAGTWDLVFSRGGQWEVPWGWYEVEAVSADYDGDGMTDVAVYHPASGNWYIQQSTDGQTRVEAFGWSAAVPLPGDYDGDGRADLAVFYQAGALWYFRMSSGGPDVSMAFGWPEVIPVPEDYDGDGVTDVAVYHPASGNWYCSESSTGEVRVVPWGWSSAIPVPADYDGDGAADIAVFYRATGTWYIRHSGGGEWVHAFGWSAVIPVPADYDGDGAADIAVYYPTGGTGFILQSSTRETNVRVQGGAEWNSVLLYPLIHSWFNLP